jgi:hypothetical protein
LDYSLQANQKTLEPESGTFRGKESDRNA